MENGELVAADADSVLDAPLEFLSSLSLTMSKTPISSEGHGARLLVCLAKAGAIATLHYSTRSTVTTL